MDARVDGPFRERSVRFSPWLLAVALTPVFLQVQYQCETGGQPYATPRCCVEFTSAQPLQRQIPDDFQAVSHHCFPELQVSRHDSRALRPIPADSCVL